jgi:hypothetical protein
VVGRTISGLSGNKETPHYSDVPSLPDLGILQLEDQGLKVWERNDGGNKSASGATVIEPLDGGYAVLLLPWSEQYNEACGDFQRTAAFTPPARGHSKVRSVCKSRP